MPRCKPRGRKPAYPAPSASPTSSRRACAASSAGSTRVASRPRPPRTSRTRATTSGGCCTTPGFTPRLFDPQEQFSLLDLGYRRDERRVSHDARLGRPAARRLRPPRRSRSASRESSRAPSRSSARRPTAGSSASGPSSAPQLRSIGVDGALRPAVDVAGERRRAVRRAAALVPRAARLARAGRPRSRARARRRRGRPRAARAVRAPGDRRDSWWATPGGGIDAGREPRARRCGASCARRPGSTTSSSGPFVYEREHSSRGTRRHRPASTTRSISCVSMPHEPRRRSTCATRASPSVRWWTLDELERRPTSGRSAGPRASACVRSWRRDRRPRRRAPARRDRVGRRLDGADLRRRAGDPHPRRRPRGRAMKELGLRWRPLGYGALLVAALTGVALAVARLGAPPGVPDRASGRRSRWPSASSSCRTSTTSCSARGCRRRSARAASS